MKTAVEWLVNQLTEIDYNCINKTFLQSDKSLAGYKMRELFDQAKEMEKEQIMDAYCDGRNSIIKHKVIHVEQYYKETFKSE